MKLIIYFLFLGLLYSSCDTNKNNNDNQEPLDIIPEMSIELESPAEFNAAVTDSLRLIAGEKLFKVMCSECHSNDGKNQWPDLKGITSRRTDEWIMKMIMDPQAHTENDKEAQKLLFEHGEYQMDNKQVNEENAHLILAYLKTLNAE